MDKGDMAYGGLISLVVSVLLLGGAINQASELKTIGEVDPMLIPAIITVGSIIILGLFSLGVFLVLKSREE